MKAKWIGTALLTVLLFSLNCGAPPPPPEVTQRVKDIPQIVLVSDSTGWAPKRELRRATLEDIEREGTAASSILRLGPNNSILAMTQSPDGQTLYFSLAEEIIDLNGEKRFVANIRSIRSTGGGITEVTSGQWLDAEPSCSRDGSYLVFSSDRIHIGKPDLFRIATQKAGGIAVIRQTADGANCQPSFGPSGMLAFTFQPRYGRHQGAERVWTLGGESGYPTELRAGSMPALSPLGDAIAYIGDDHQLWVMPPGGQNPVQLTSEPINLGGKRNPTWSPNGDFILFASDVGKDSQNEANYDIWIVKRDGTGLRQLTTNGSEDDYPLVSGDQKYIHFVSNRGFKQGIWRIPFPASLD